MISFHIPAKAAAVFVIACLSAGISTADDIGRLPDPVKKILATHKLPKDSLSLYIQQYDASQPLLSINGNISRTPASVMKLLTTYAGLQLLAPNYTWETHIHLDGKLEDGTLNGNLIIEGGGDPYLVKETFWHLLFTLRNRGLTHINGDILIDDEWSEEETGHPKDFDNRPHHVYNAFPSASLLNFHAHQFYFIPTGNKVHIYPDPPAANLKVKNKLRLVNGHCKRKYRNVRFNVVKQNAVTTVEFDDDYPRRCGNQHLLRTVLTADDYIFGVFKTLWQSMGGTISGSAGKTSVDFSRPFYAVRSKPLSEIIIYINKFSNNVMARQLLLTIGSTSPETIDSKNGGKQAIADWLTKIGIPAPELIIENGSGLSRHAQISARTLALILQHALHSPYQPEFFASLPLVGVDGTMRKRLSGEIAPGAARIKTGIIDNVRTMAGYVRGKDDKGYILVALQNHPGIHRGIGTRVQDAILKWLYNR